MWPLHPQPYDDELLSSWLIRIAHANRYKAYDFYCSYFGREAQIWNRDIDASAQDWLIEGLSFHTGLNNSKITSLTLRKFEGIVFEKIKPHGITPNLLSIGVYHRKRRAFGLQFCPDCLAESAYLKNSWRIPYLTVCHKHSRLLHDRCEQCLNPFTPHRVDMVKKSELARGITILDCGYCQHSISSCTVKEPHPNMIRFNRSLNDCIESGYFELKGTEVDSLYFFQGLRILAQGFRRLHKDPLIPGTNATQMELSGHAARHELMRLCERALSDWPNSFHQMTYGNTQVYSLFISRSRDCNAPDWIKQEVKRSY